MQAQLQEQEKEQHARIAIHHYHCDHLGTPMALTDQTGQVPWVAKLDPCGNVLHEYNPQGTSRRGLRYGVVNKDRFIKHNT